MIKSKAAYESLHEVSPQAIVISIDNHRVLYRFFRSITVFNLCEESLEAMRPALCRLTETVTFSCNIWIEEGTFQHDQALYLSRFFFVIITVVERLNVFWVKHLVDVSCWDTEAELRALFVF